MKQPCLDCGRISTGARCTEHAAIVRARGQARHTARRHQRGGPRNRGGGSLGGVPAGSTCWLCGKPQTSPTDPMQWDHLIPVRKGGSDGGLLPAHRSCNIRRHAEQVKAERRAIERDALDRKLFRGRYALMTEGPGDQTGPGSISGCQESK